MKLTYVDRITLPAEAGGIDFRAPRTLLIASPDTLAPAVSLQWHKGHTGWYRLGETTYYPATLVLRTASDPCGDDIHEGGRLSLGVLLYYRKTLASAFHYPFTIEDLRPITSREPKTLILKDD